MEPSIRPLFRHHLAKKFIVRNLPPGSVIFDVGCGRGDLDFLLAKKGYDLECFEYSEEAIRAFAALREKYKAENIVLHQGNFMTMEIPRKADVIISHEVIEHLDDDEAAIRKMRAWLNPEGYLMISVPAHMSKWGVDDEIFGHKRRYERNQLIGLLRGQGFEIMHIFSYGFPWLNILKKIRECIVSIRPPKFTAKDKPDRIELGTKKSGVGYFKSSLWSLIFNPITFSPLFLISDMFNSLDWSEGYYVIVRKIPQQGN